MERSHEYIFVDEAGFNLTKRRRGKNKTGLCAIAEVPHQRGGNVTLCAAISYLHHHGTLGPYDTKHLHTFSSGFRDPIYIMVSVFIILSGFVSSST